MFPQYYSCAERMLSWNGVYSGLAACVCLKDLKSNLLVLAMYWGDFSVRLCNAFAASSRIPLQNNKQH